MFAGKYRQVFLVLFSLFAVLSKAKANQTQILVTSATSVLMMPGKTTVSNSQIKPSSIILTTNPARGQSITTGRQERTTIGMPVSEEETLKPYVIIIIAASAAVVLIAIALLLLLCFFRRRRIQRLERERNLSYNNMNYESTVKFRADIETDDTLDSDKGTTSPRKTNNNPRRDAGYEIVDLPNVSNDKIQANRPYENVTPQHVVETNDTPRSKQPYENVTPMVSSANDEAKAPGGRYEEVFLDPPKKSEDDKKKRNDKYYENVELNN